MAPSTASAPRVAEEHLRVVEERGTSAREALGQLDRSAGAAHDRGVHAARRSCGSDGRDHVRVAVADVGDRDARRRGRGSGGRRRRSATSPRPSIGDDVEVRAAARRPARVVVASQPRRCGRRVRSIDGHHGALPGGVDLGPLQPARVVDVHGLHLAELLDAARARPRGSRCRCASCRRTGSGISAPIVGAFT